ncbi:MULTISPECIES: ComEA family DNA-binding protein [Caldilinea]|jgi:competence protein ComEA|uniref:ComEA family DNA-binding protein n=1 Tax=Caldilinea TaxID=233191 RepID=UPI0002EF2D5C|nr:MULTISPECIES: ComEA family DNA-binding protein [Caldilinea]MBO9395002.1 ComEA family DNA-binding protein [Caldilinea sp.]GIV73863.1 MAG: hypothetical protein KatS3mg049_2419 [Caldilinea sp.]
MSISSQTTDTPFAAAEHPSQPAHPQVASPLRAVLLPYLLGLLTAFTLSGVGFLMLRRPDPPPIQIVPPPTPAPTATFTPTPTPGPIVIYVSGAVKAPGVFTLPADARVADAIAAAGGLREDADPARINLAARLFDAAQVHVLAVDERGDVQAPVLLSGLLPTPTPEMHSMAGTSSAQRLIDLNTATRAELESLPGIGASKAQAIIDNRPYATVDELERVPGIGPATVNRLRALVTVQSQP